MEKILIIHPNDETTRFLTSIYKNSENKNLTIINDVNISNSCLVKKIKEHDIIMILGHGCKDGLLSSNSKYQRFNRLMINSKHVYLLRQKTVIGIWCHANEFFEKYRIKGFATSMFVSELDEANDNCLPMSCVDIEENNQLLASCLFTSLKYYCEPKFIYYYLSLMFNKHKENKIMIFNQNGFKLYI